MDATAPADRARFPPDGARFRFGSFVLDAATRELRRDGRLVALEPKVFDLLLYLVRHADRVVSKAELLHAIWSGDAFSPGVLAQCIWSARSAIEDDGRNQSCIRTVRGLGYRFSAQVAIEWGALPIAASGSIALVGRRRELTTCELLLQAARLGHGRGYWLQAGTGCGKTRLLSEFARLAAKQGVRVASGHCYASDTVPAFWPFYEILDQLRVARPTLDAELDAFGAADAIARALCAEAASWPLAVLVDDLHFAEPASLAVIELLASARQAPQLLLVATSSPQIPNEALLPLARRSWLRREWLAPLSTEELARDLQLTNSTAEKLAALTGGHPACVHWTLLTLRQVLAFDGTTFDSVLDDPVFRAAVAGSSSSADDLLR